MCGITACRGADAGRRTLDGLRELEYRGYDSAGLASITSSGLQLKRSIGKIANLVADLDADPRLVSAEVRLAIGHTRWATHGEASVLNAHPLIDCTGRIAVVHNGVLENSADLRAELMLAGHTFAAEVDSEVIAHLMEASLQLGASPFEALLKTTARLQGAWAIAALVEGWDALLVARRGSPLLVRGVPGLVMVASDARATTGVAGPLRSLDDGDVVELGARWHWSGSRGPDQLPPALAKAKTTSARRPMIGRSFPDAMAREIAEQPLVIGDLVEELLGELSRRGSWKRLGVPVPSSVLLLACGTSFHAAQVIARVLTEVAGITAHAVIASEYDPQFVHAADVTVALSQSGETTDLLSALDRSAAPVVAITNSVWSSLARRADAVLDCGAGQERGVAATKSFTAQVVRGVGLALAATEAIAGAKSTAGLQRLLAGLPTELAATESAGRESAAMLAAELTDAPGWLFLGSGSALPYAAEGALKLKEVTYRWAQTYPSGELKHGPLALVEAGTPAVVIDNGLTRLTTSIAELTARGARVIRVGGAHSELGPSRLSQDPPWGPLASIPALQHLARELGVVLGRDIDRPRNLAKSVTVA